MINFSNDEAADLDEIPPEGKTIFLKGVQEEIPSEEASTLQINSVAFPPGHCTSLQLHPCHRLFDQDGH